MPPAADEDFRHPGAPARRADGPASGGVTPGGAIEPLDGNDAAALALNNAHATELSYLEPPCLAHLVRQAFLARRIGTIDALLIAFDQDADYDSPNFLWFRDRYPRFIYVDRIVVAPAHRGRNFARRLYDDLFDQARRRGHEQIVCEVNTEPPNPASDAFHARLGFVEVGQAVLPGCAKAVRYLKRGLSGDP